MVVWTGGGTADLDPVTGGAAGIAAAVGTATAAVIAAAAVVAAETAIAGLPLAMVRS